MLACFIHGNDGVILIVGITPKDLTLMVGGVPAPLIDLQAIGAQLDCGPPTDLQIIFGATEEEIAQRVGMVLGEDAEPLTQIHQDGLERQYAEEANEASPAHVAAHTAEELAIKRARARLN